MLNRKQSEILTGQGSYAVILLVLLLGSLKIAKFSGVSVHCNFPAFFQLCTYTTFEYLVRILFHLTVYVNVTILRKYSGNVRACASSRYQAISLLPRGLDTRLNRYPLSHKHKHFISCLQCNVFEKLLNNFEALSLGPFHKHLYTRLTHYSISK